MVRISNIVILHPLCPHSIALGKTYGKTLNDNGVYINLLSEKPSSIENDLLIALQVTSIPVVIPVIGGQVFCGVEAFQWLQKTYPDISHIQAGQTDVSELSGSLYFDHTDQQCAIQHCPERTIQHLPQ